MRQREMKNEERKAERSRDAQRDTNRERERETTKPRDRERGEGNSKRIDKDRVMMHREDNKGRERKKTSEEREMRNEKIKTE